MMPILRAYGIVIIAVLLTGCGDDAESPAQTIDNSGGSKVTQSESASARDNESGTSAIAGEESVVTTPFCDLLSGEEVQTILGTEIPLGPAEENRSGCKYPIKFGAPGNAFAYNELSTGNYNAYKGYEKQSSVEFEYVEGLGIEAFVLNNSQVCVLLSETEALSVGVMMLSVQEPLPVAPEVIKERLITITRHLVQAM